MSAFERFLFIAIFLFCGVPNVSGQSPRIPRIDVQTTLETVAWPDTDGREQDDPVWRFYQEINLLRDRYVSGVERSLDSYKHLDRHSNANGDNIEGLHLAWNYGYTRGGDKYKFHKYDSRADRWIPQSEKVVFENAVTYSATGNKLSINDVSVYTYLDMWESDCGPDPDFNTCNAGTRADNHRRITSSTINASTTHSNVRHRYWVTNPGEGPDPEARTRGIEVTFYYIARHLTKEMVLTSSSEGATGGAICANSTVTIQPRLNPGVSGTGFWQVERALAGTEGWSNYTTCSNAGFTIDAEDVYGYKFRCYLKNSTAFGNIGESTYSTVFEPGSLIIIPSISSVYGSSINDDIVVSDACPGQTTGSISLKPAINTDTDIRLIVQRGNVSIGSRNFNSANGGTVSGIPTGNNYTVIAQTIASNGTGTFGECSRNVSDVSVGTHPVTPFNIVATQPSCGGNGSVVVSVPFGSSSPDGFLTVSYVTSDGRTGFVGNPTSTGGLNNYFFNDLPPGTYTFTTITPVASGGCRRDSDPIVLTAEEPAQVSTTTPRQRNGGQFDIVCDNGLAELRLTTDQTATQQVVLTNDATGEEYNINVIPNETATLNVAEGNYSLLVTNTATSCQYSEINSIIVTENPDAELFGTPAVGNIHYRALSECDPNSGGQGFTVTSNVNVDYVEVNGVRYNFAGFQRYVVLQNLMATNAVVIRNVDGCMSSQTLSLPTDQLTVSTGVTPVSCSGAADGAITINASNTFPVFPTNYQYTLDGPNMSPLVESGGGTFTFDNLAAGEYSVSVQDNRGCSRSMTVTITEPAAIAIDNISVADAPFCYQGVSLVTFEVSGPEVCDAAQAISTYEYRLNADSDWLPLDELATDVTACTTTVSFTEEVAPGTYPIQIRLISSGCESSIERLTENEFNVRERTTATITTFDVTCNGANDGRIVVVVNGNGTGNYQVRLGSGFPGGGTTLISNQFLPPTGGTVTFDNLPPRSGGDPLYKILITNQTSFCNTILPGSQSLVINEPAVLVTTLNPDISPRCDGTGGQVIATTTGGTPPYRYSINGAAFQNIPVLVAGVSNTIITRDANDCEVTDNIELEAEDTEIVVTSSVTQATACTPASVSLTLTNGTEPYTATVTHDATATDVFSGLVTSNQIIVPGSGNVLLAGNYTVTVSDDEGCMPSAPAVFTINPTPILDTLTGSVQVTGTDCFGDATGQVSFQVTGGSNDYQVTANGNAIQAVRNGDDYTFTGLSAGVLTVQILDVNTGCIVFRQLTVPGASQIAANATQQNFNTCGSDNNVSLIISPTGGTAPYTVIFNTDLSDVRTVNAGQSTTLSQLGPQDLNVAITDANNCLRNFPVTINGPAQISATPTIQQPLCDGSPDGSIQLGINGGSGAYFIRLNGGPQTTNTSFSNLAAGNYSFTIEDGSGCTFPGNPLLIELVNSTDLTLGADAGARVCAGTSTGSVTLQASAGSGNYEYRIEDEPYVNNPVFSGLAAGDYSFTVRDGSSCEFTTTVSVEAFPEITTDITINQESCNGNNDASITVTTSGGDGSYTYTLNDGPAQSENVFAGLSSGTYSVVTTDGNGCTLTSDNISITATPVLTATAFGSDVSCPDLTVGSAFIEVEGGTQPYRYRLVDAELQDSRFIDDLPPGTYSFEVVDANDCVAATNPVTISAPQPFTIFSQTITPENCNQADGSISVVVTGGTGELFLDWSNEESGNTISGLTAGSYTLFISDNNECGAEFTLVVPAAAGITVTAETTPEFCERTDGTATLTASGPQSNLTYTWETGVANNGATASGLAAGKYAYTVTNTLTTCEVSDTVTIAAEAGPSISEPLVTDATCELDNGSIFVEPLGGTGPYTYTWSHSTEVVTGEATELADGEYFVTITDVNDCSVTASATVGRAGGPEVSVASFRNTICEEGNGSIELEVTGGTNPLSFSWSGNVSTTNQATGLSAGTYSVTVTDANQCQRIVSQEIRLISGPEATVVAQTVDSCGLGLATLAIGASGGTYPYEFFWGDDEVSTDSVRTGLNAGTYTIRVVDANGCDDVIAANISATTPPVLELVTVENSSCTDDNGTATVAVTSGGTEPFVYAWSHDATLSGPVASDLSSGDYVVTVTDAFACTSVLPITVDFTPGPTAVLLIDQIPGTCGRANASLEVAPADGTGPFTYAWSHDADLSAPLAPNLAAGEYTVTITDALGCTVADTFTVDPSLPIELRLDEAINTACNQSIGSAAVSVDNATGDITYEWSVAGGNGSMISGLAAGTYTVTATDANLCTDILEFIIGNDAGPELSVVNVTDAICTDASGSITFTASNGLRPYVYSWSHDATITDSVATDLVAGSYVITVTDANGCNSILSQNVGLQAAPVLSVATSSPEICGRANGTISLAVTGGTGELSYRWSHDTELATATAANLPAGNYAATVTDANGCTAEISTVLTEISGPTSLTATETINTTCGEDNGALTLTAAGGTGPYTYTWSHDATISGPTATDLASGTYDVTMTDANDCERSASFSIGESASLELTLSSSTNAACGQSSGSATVAFSNATGTVRLVWSVTPQPEGLTATGLPSGSYTVTAIDDLDCTATLTFNISDEDGPMATVVSSQNAICTDDNGNIVVSVTGGLAPYSYNWSHDNALDAPTVTSLGAGTYSVTATDANGCNATVSATLEFEAPPVVTLQETTPEFCGQSNGTITLSVDGGAVPYRYDWSHDELNSTGSASGLAAGPYQVSVTDANECTTVFTYDLPEQTGPTAITALTQVPTTCGTSNGSLTLETVGGTPGYVYSWSHDAELDGPNANNLSAGEYTVTVTDANGCSLAETFVIDGSLPIVITVVSFINASCGQSNGSVTVSVSDATEPVSYQWSLEGQADSPTLTNAPAGIYAVTVTDALGCTATTEAEIGNDDGPTLTTTQVMNATCTNDNGSITVSVTDGTVPYQFNWSHDVNLNDATANGLSSGTYSVTVTDQNGCTDVLTNTLEFEAAPVLSLGTVSDEICGGSNGTVSVIVTGGTAPYAYAWSHSATLNSPNANDLIAGAYTLTVTDVNQCSVAITATVGSTSGPTGLEATENLPTTCGLDNGALTVEAAGGTEPYQYSWNHDPDLTGNVAFNLPAGEYLVRVTDANDCMLSETFTVGDSQPLQLIPDGQTDASCGQADGSFTVATLESTGMVNYEWSAPGQPNSPTATGLMAGTYGVTATDANACTTSLTFTIANQDGPTAEVAEAVDATCTDDNGSITVSLSGGTLPYTYSWSHDANLDGPVAADLGQGNYFLTVTDDNGCQVIIQQQIEFFGPPVLTLTDIQPAYCAQDNGSLAVSVSGGTGAYAFSWSHDAALTGPEAAQLAPGEYTLVVTDENGCQAIETYTIIEDSGITEVELVSQVETSCGLDNGEIQVSPVGGTGPFTYDWSTGQSFTTGLLDGLSAGSYTVTITDVNACQAIDTYVIQNSQPLELVEVSRTDAACGQANGSISVATLNAQGNVTLNWSLTNPPAGNTATGLPAGAYSVTATDEQGCSSTLSFTIENQDGPQVTLVDKTDAVCTDDNGSIEIAVTDGLAPYTYTWNTPQNVTGTFAPDLPAGTFTVTVTDANGCESTLTETIRFLGGIAGLLEMTNPDLCDQATGELQVVTTDGQPPFVYSWAHDATLAASTATDLEAGTYFVTVTDARNCSVALEGIVSTVAGPEALVSLDNQPGTCGRANGSLTLSVNGGTSPYTYRWPHDASITGSTADGLIAGTYRVTVTDANGCSLSETFTVQDVPGPELTVVSTENAACGQANGTATVSATGGTGIITYRWGIDPEPNGPTATELSAGVYSVTATDENGCTATVNVVIGNEDGPEVSVVAFEDSDCTNDNGSIALNVTGGSTPYTYFWSHDTDLTGNEATGLAGGVYNITVTDANGCTGVTSQTVRFLAPAEVSLEVTEPGCQNANGGMITANVSGGEAPYTYTWSDNSTGSSITGLAGGTYSLSVTTANGCTTIATASLTTFAGITAEVTAGSTCAGRNSGELTVNAAGGVGELTYTWSSGGNAATEMGLAAGDYFVTVSDANGCTVVLEGTVTEVPLPFIRVAEVVNVPCQGASGAVTFVLPDVPNGYAFSFTGGNDPVVMSLGDSISLRYEGLSVGSYELLVSAPNGCSTSRTVALQSDVAWTVAVSGVAPVTCFGGNDGRASLTPSNDLLTYTYAWPDGGTGANRNDLAAGTYDVVITDSNGCSNVASLTIGTPDELLVTVVDNVTPDCGEANGSITLAVSGGTVPYNFSWSDDLPGGSEVSGLEAGTYTVAVTDANGCSLTTVVEVEAPDGAGLSFTGVPMDTTLCAGNIYVLDLSGLENIVISGPDGFRSTDSVSLIETSGAYQLTAGQGSCTISQTVNVVFRDNPFVADFVMASDVVIGDTVVVVEVSYPFAPDNVSWSFDQATTELLSQEDNEYRFRFSALGQQTLSMVATSGGCQDVVSNSVIVHADSSTIAGPGAIELDITELTVAPNPTQGAFTVRVLLAAEQPVVLSLYDGNGMLVDRRRSAATLEHTADYDLNLTGGMYQLQIVTPTARRTVSVVVVN